MDTQEIINKKILEKLEISDLPNDIQEEVLDDIGGMVINAVLLQSLNTLSDDQQKGLEQLKESANTTLVEVFAFLEKNIPNFEEIVIEEGNRILEEIQTASEKTEV